MTRPVRVAGAAVLVWAAVAAGLATAAQGGSGPVPPCRADQLVVAHGRSGVATGHFKTVVVLTNVVAPACSLRGYPGIRLIDGHGRPIRTLAHRGGGFTFPAVAARAVVLRPGDHASFALGGDTLGAGGRACPAAAAIQVSPPRTRTRIAVDVGVPVCGGRVDVSAIVAGRRGPEFGAGS